MIVLAFSANLFAENSNFCAGFCTQRIQFVRRIETETETLGQLGEKFLKCTEVFEIFMEKFLIHPAFVLLRWTFQELSFRVKETALCWAGWVGGPLLSDNFKIIFSKFKLKKKQHCAGLGRWAPAIR